MTLPDERFRAVKAAREFLRDLLDPKKTPKTASVVRERARAVLRHFPWDTDMEAVAEKCPEIFERKKI